VSGTARSARVPPGMVEFLRLLVVIFLAGIGYEVAQAIGSGRELLGPFNGVAIGVIVGSGLGYVLGGVLGRSTVSAADRAQLALRETSAESLVAGAIGLVIGVLVGAGAAWPVFLIPQPFLSVPLFAFIVAIFAFVGYAVGSSKRDGMLAMFGAQAGRAPRRLSAAALPRVVDSSVAIDGRVIDVVRAGFLHGTMLITTPVLGELQGLADAGDDLRRARGRRGLEVLETVRREPGIDVVVIDDEVPGVADVDAKLVRLCLDAQAALLTLDTNLARVAALAGVQVLNLHALALALRPAVTAGDEVYVLLVKPGKEPGQAVGYLDDGTMVVAERARAHLGAELRIRVTSVLTTANGRLVFARPAAEGFGVPPPRPPGVAPSMPASNPPISQRATPADVPHRRRSG